MLISSLIFVTMFAIFSDNSRCKIPAIDDNSTYKANETLIAELLIPVNDDGDYDNCSM